MKKHPLIDIFEYALAKVLIKHFVDTLFEPGGMIDYIVMRRYRYINHSTPNQRRKKMRILPPVMTMTCLLMISCAPTHFTHPTKTTADFEHDKYECRLAAEQSAANWGMHGNPFVIADEIKKCLRYRYGWQVANQ